MKKLLSILAAIFIATAAMAQTADELYQKGREAFGAHNFTEGFTLLEKAGNMGHVEAQYILALLYKEGAGGVEKDVKKAAKWFEKAASQGKVEAQLRIAMLYRNGEGVEKNMKKAISWWEKAADQGNEDALCILGVCYYEGEGVPKDTKKGLELLHKAAAQGSQDATDILKKIGQ